jgi:hypothetical protein
VTHVIAGLAGLALDLARLLGHLAARVGDDAGKEADALVEDEPELRARHEEDGNLLERTEELGRVLSEVLGERGLLTPRNEGRAGRRARKE